MTKYAKDNGFAVILDTSNPQTPVLWAESSVDVTKDVVDAYNVVSGVPPPVPAPAAAKPAAGPGTTGAAARRPATPPPSTNPPK